MRARIAAARALEDCGDVRMLNRMPRPLRLAWLDALLPKVTAWRFVSAALLDDLCEGLDASRVKCIRKRAYVRPMQMHPIAPADRAARASSSQPRYASVGRLIPSKRVDRALHFAKHKGARLLVVGDGPERSALQVLAAQLGVQAEFTGLLPHAIALNAMAKSDALLMASEAEGQSTVVREAEALGVPVVWL
jgi:teichuronic acid biosynthesis glycosyltransferase TuaC